MSKFLNVAALSILGAVILSLAPATFSQDHGALPMDSLTAPERHRIEGEAKAQALDRSRRMQQLAASMPQDDQSNYDVKWYDITFRVNDTTEILYGVVKFVALATINNVSQIDVSFYSGMSVDQIVGPSGPLTFTRTGDFVTVTLDRSYNTGEEFAFDFYYSGHPVESGFQAFAFDWYNGKRSITTLSEPYFAHTWWPCKDRMDDKPDSIGIHIEVDTSLYCASNGTLDSITAGSGPNSRVFNYTNHYPIATYLFSVAIAPYVVWQQNYIYNGGLDTMPVVHHAYQDRYSLSLTTWINTPTYIAALAAAYGPYPFPKDKYGHANFNWGGAMEHQTCTSMQGNTTFGFDTWVIVHELSHQWWGDLVTCKSWHDIWLNEGWASYSEAVYQLAASGWSAYRTYMNSMAYKGPGTVWCDDTTSVNRIFNGSLSYDKGAWVVHMLRGVLGEDLFAQGIVAYRNAFANSAATTEDFRNVWETTTGVNLYSFINEWVYGQNCPNYTYYFMSEPSDTGGYDTYLVVKQTQTTLPTVFDMPVQFFFDYATMPDDTVRLVVNERSQLFKFNLPSAVNQITLDPAGWILKNATNPAWRMSIITLQPELSGGWRSRPYLDTIETRGGTGPNVISISDGILPPGLTIDAAGVISGSPTTLGVYPFTVGIANPGTGASDQRSFQIEILEPSCCTGLVGNVNGLAGDEPTIGDISMLIDALFVSGVTLPCLTEADINQSGGANPTRDDITIGDISLLIDHVFITGVPLLPCL